MSTVVIMPAVSFGDGRPLSGVVLKTYRLGRQSVDINEPLADVRIGGHILTVCANRDGFLYAMYAQVGATVEAGQTIALLGGLRVEETHEIFVAYRRGDSLGHAGRIAELLTRTFGRWQVFQDIESLPPGRDFVEQVRSALGRTLAVVVVVGPRWLSGSPGERRIDNPGDLHREEIRTALQRGLRIFPVLVDGAKMPHPHELPEDIRALSTIQAIELSDTRWEYDTARLIGALSSFLVDAKDRSNPHSRDTRRA